MGYEILRLNYYSVICNLCNNHWFFFFILLLSYCLYISLDSKPANYWKDIVTLPSTEQLTKMFVWHGDANGKERLEERRGKNRRDRGTRKMCAYYNLLNFSWKKKEWFKFNKEREGREIGEKYEAKDRKMRAGKKTDIKKALKRR